MKLQSFVTLVSQFERIAHDNNAVEKVTKRNIILRFVTQHPSAFAYNKS